MTGGRVDFGDGAGGIDSLANAGQTNTQRAAEAQFQAFAGSTFTVFGARAFTHTALGTLGIARSGAAWA